MLYYKKTKIFIPHYLEEFKNELKLDVIPISAFTKDNLNELIYKVADKLDEVKSIPDPIIETEVVEYKFVKKEDPFTIEKTDEGLYNVIGPAVKKIFDSTDFNREESVKMFAKRIRDLGVDAKLKELGVQDGDTVLIFNYEFEFYNQLLN